MTFLISIFRIILRGTFLFIPFFIFFPWCSFEKKNDILKTKSTKNLWKIRYVFFDRYFYIRNLYKKKPDLDRAVAESPIYAYKYSNRILKDLYCDFVHSEYTSIYTPKINISILSFQYFVVLMFRDCSILPL